MEKVAKQREARTRDTERQKINKKINKLDKLPLDVHNEAKKKHKEMWTKRPLRHVEW